MDNMIVEFGEFLDYYNVSDSCNNKMACVELTPDFVNKGSAPAAYMNMFSFVLTKKGRISFEINHKNIIVGEGEMLAIFPGLFVGSRIDADEDFEGINFLCERYLFEHFVTSRPEYEQFALFFSTRFPLIRLYGRQFADVLQTMEQIRRQVAGPCPYQEDILLHLLNIFMLQILGIIEDKDSVGPSKLSHSDVIFLRFVQLAMTHYRQEHQIKFYADELCISSTYLSRMTRISTGRTVNDFLSGLLYSEACRLLADTDKSINAIADELCFADQSSFGKFFKTQYGASPMAYRSQWKAKNIT